MFTNGVIKPGVEAATSIAIFFSAAWLSGVHLVWIWLLLTVPWILISMRFAKGLRRASVRTWPRAKRPPDVR